MRSFDTVPKAELPYENYGFDEPIGGADYLLAPLNDIRWAACSGDFEHPLSASLPVVFFEILSTRFAKTSDLDSILRKLPLPFPLRNKFKKDELADYINRVLENFPVIFRRAAYIADEAALSEDFSLEIDKTDLEQIYAKNLKVASPRDIAPLAEGVAKLKGWNEEVEIGTMSVAVILNQLKRPNTGKFQPLPSDFPSKKLNK